jgi:hypothetical protein
MPVGEILRDPITGLTYEVVESWSGKKLNELLERRRELEPKHVGFSHERCSLYGGKPARSTPAKRGQP